MVKKNPVYCKQVIPFTIILDHPIGVDLCSCVGASGSERSELVLRGWRIPEHLAARGLVESGFDPASSDGLQETCCPQAGHVSREFWCVKAHAHVALGSQVIDFIGTNVIDQLRHLSGIRQIPIVQEQLRLWIVGVNVEVVNTIRVEGTGPANQTVDLVAFFYKKFSQVRAVLSGDAGDECFHGFGLFR